MGELPSAFDNNTTPFLRLQADAQECLYAWLTPLMNHLRTGVEHAAVESHLSKYRKLVPALALIIHLVESDGGPVTLDAVTRAIGWADYLESHARRIFSRGIHPATAHARALAHPRVAQQAMRHSRLELTTQFYTDPILLDVAGAVNALPDFSGGKSQAARQCLASVGA